MVRFLCGRGIWLVAAGVVLAEFMIAAWVVLSFGSGNPCPGT